MLVVYKDSGNDLNFFITTNFPIDGFLLYFPIYEFSLCFKKVHMASFNLKLDNNHFDDSEGVCYI